jgi:tetratricopeptide (TPR) repeat protein
MAAEHKRDLAYETTFFESVLRRDRSYELVIEILGNLYTRQGRIADGLKMDRKLVKLQPENDVAHYNLACSLALMKRRADALRILRKAIELGYDDHEHMAKDSDLDSLREHPEFVGMMEQLIAK